MIRSKIMAERVSIIVFSGTVDKLMAASILTTGGAAMGLEVEVFLTTWGLEAFRKDGYKTNMRVSKDFEEYAPSHVLLHRKPGMNGFVFCLTVTPPIYLLFLLER
jgi:peroxiredoxin family protein